MIMSRRMKWVGHVARVGGDVSIQDFGEKIKYEVDH
jgi:hypothetical protein